ncbi:Thiamine phosphate phosphatase-like protein [Thalictrum thalictroides]|uniref:Thiamine phosphate phosphatase-like protein n=1 Tax=Thalictrum thalictroides TaxID=46969 RepID=A0A7J6WWU4_THATH|nr:Thiamine phosphate phosphatase-like protein [Thalictrum thalictroides]
MAGIVVVFDFDKTIIDCDSDNWVVDDLGATDLFNDLLPTMPWNTLMDKMMKELHSQGRTIEEIVECLHRAPLIPQIISTIKSAHALGCELRILSDANLFFIETILKHHGLMDYFSEINTNPGFVDEGRLKIFPYHDFISSSHGCDLCPPNMCKGLVFEKIRASAFAEGNKRFFYLGDGKGDYCPSLKLVENDYVLPRKNYPLWELISNNPLLLKANIYEWSNGEKLEQILIHLLEKTIVEETSLTNSSANDCKFQTMPISNHEPTPQALPVQN